MKDGPQLIFAEFHLERTFLRPFDATAHWCGLALLNYMTMYEAKNQPVSLQTAKVAWQTAAQI